jgi:uncharacterized protein (TIGR02118 family)
MYKSIALLKRRSDLSREAFIDYYESRHVPLIRSLLPEICGYRRNFIEDEGAFINAGAAARDFDVITELWYPDRGAYEAAMARYALPEVAGAIAADEENFLDRSTTRMFVVDERISDFG